MTVKRPEELKTVSDEVLAGLSATEDLKKKILYRAANQLLEKEDGKKQTKKNANWLKAVPALCCCLALIVCGAVLIPKIGANNRTAGTDFPEIKDIAAGNYVVSTEMPIIASTKVNTGSRKIISEAGDGFFMNRVPGDQTSGQNSLQAISLDGRIYRLTSFQYDTDMPGLIPVGEIKYSADYQELLRNDKETGSTFLQPGTVLYTVDGMNGAFVIAEYNGALIAFQRVSLENRGVLHGEQLTDLIPSFDHVISIGIDGKTVTDPEVIAEIGRILKEYSVLEDNGAVSSGNKMLLELDNGMICQLILDGERICGCGTWTCVEFFEYIGGI